MKDKIANISRWVLYLLLALSVISGVVFYLFYDSGRALTVLLEDLDIRRYTFPTFHPQ